MMKSMNEAQLGAWLTAAAATAGGGFLGYAARGRSSAFFAPSMYHGDRSRPALALTFDDGPSESTPALLEILAGHDVRATFFMCGENVRRLPCIAREVSARGHEIGNHTDTHPRLHFKSPEFIYREMALAQETIRAATGVTPRLFRAPYGVRWFGLRGAQERLGLTGVMWTVIGRDWRWPGVRVARRLIDGAANGGILCLHDGRTIRPTPDIRATLEALRAALPRLRERGFSFETVSEMLCLKN
jgi:peptidoglycan/xylan/chitin deacetylase (PgdA/CDA1 family)